MPQLGHIYDLHEEAGTWYITIDGQPFRNQVFTDHHTAITELRRLTAMNNLWTGIFKVETTIAEAFSGRPRPYGATLRNTNEGTDQPPVWILSEPYRNEPERMVSPDPTGHIQPNVYDRSMYVEACGIAGIDPDDDDDITDEHSDSDGGYYIPDTVTPADALRIRLGYRRYLGIDVERTADIRERLAKLKEAGLRHGPLSRDQYLTACEIMGAQALSDCMVGTIAGDRTDEALPTDPITLHLACRRYDGGREE